MPVQWWFQRCWLVPVSGYTRGKLCSDLEYILWIVLCLFVFVFRRWGSHHGSQASPRLRSSCLSL